MLLCEYCEDLDGDFWPSKEETQAQIKKDEQVADGTETVSSVGTELQVTLRSHDI